MNEIPKEAFPLTWPAGKTRTPPWKRKRGAFGEWSFGRVRDMMLSELRKLGASDVILSSNVPVRQDGLPYANTREPDDGGIAVYFERKGKPYVLACDAYDRTSKNLRALTLVIDAIRSIERHGTGEMMEQAFQGFTALPAHAAEPSWWDVLGVTPDASLTEIEFAHERLTRQHHPDIGGDHETMARINRARDVARDERS